MPEIEERVRQWFLKRARKSPTGKVLTKGVMASLRAEVLNDPVAIRKALMLLREDGHIQFNPNERGEPVSSYIIVIKPAEEIQPHVQNWSSVLKEKGLAAAEMEALMPAADAVSDFSEDDMARLLDGLLRLRHDQVAVHGLPGYLVSAEYLLGSSKLLSSLPRRALKAFGIDPGRFSSHPLYVVVAGPASPEAVVLVENPAAFERAVGTKAVSWCAFVATFGFGLSNAQEDYGNQLAGMVEDRFAHAITLRREGSTCPDARTLLSHGNITFWGDLDPAGIEIYLRLKRSVPLLQLSELYKSMTKFLALKGESHPYVKSVGKERQTSMMKSALHGDIAASWLGKLCALRGVDQEKVLASDIERFAQLPLDMGASPCLTS